MNIKRSMLYKSLVFVVIILFIGVAFQPVIIAVNPISPDNEEDCSICPKVSKQHLVRLKSLINRVETLNNKLSVLSKLNPEAEEKYQKLSERITTIKEMSKELNPDRDYPIICTIFEILFIPLAIIYYLTDIFIDFYIIAFILIPLAVLGTLIYSPILFYGVALDCWDIDWEEIWEIIGWRPPWY